MADDVVLNKAASIERRLARICEEYGGKREHLYENQTKQDAIVLNLQRACETAIDLAMYVVRRKGLGLPQESRDAFALLEKAQLLSAELAGRLQRMVGFRNVAVHEYTRLNPDIVQTIITKHLDDFRRFSSTIVKACAQRGDRTAQAVITNHANLTPQSQFTIPLSADSTYLAGCGKSPPAAFSHRSAAHRTARVRFATSLAAALLDGHFAHPAGASDTNTPREPIALYCAKIEFFRSLLDVESR